MKAVEQDTQPGHHETCRSNPMLVLADSAFSDEVVRRLIDDWIVPALVEQFLNDSTGLPDSAKGEHNQIL